MPNWALLLQRELGERFLFVVADPRTCQDFVDLFQIPSANLPTAVIYDTASEQDTDGDGEYLLGEPLSEEALRRFVDDFLRKTGRPPSKCRHIPLRPP